MFIMNSKIIYFFSNKFNFGNFYMFNFGIIRIILKIILVKNKILFYF